jgi:D-methionine transport system ATP-binding protein
MIQLDQVSKRFATPQGQTFTAVNPTSLQIAAGEVHGIIGFSGAGKSTLLRLINLLEVPSGGRVIVDGKELTAMRKADLRAARRNIGMIFQHFNLLHNRTVSGNVAFALEVAGTPRAEIGPRVKECLEIVGLSDKTDSYPAALSGGQKQRVAIARALASRPQILLCDEPTSALDPYTTRDILEVLADINARLGVTIVIVSHSMSVVRAICDTISVMDAGNIIERIDLADSVVTPVTEVARKLLDDVPTNVNVRRLNALRAAA